MLHYVAARAADRPTRLDAAPQALHLSERATYRALIALAASGLITHQRDGEGLGLVQITPRGQAKATPVAE